MMGLGKNGATLMIRRLFKSIMVLWIKFYLVQLTQINSYFTMALMINYGDDLHVRTRD